MICAVVFDLDGLLVDSEVYWEQARRAYAGSQGCDWTELDEQRAKGMNSSEWATLIQQRCCLTASRDLIIQGVIEYMDEYYRARLPLLPGAASSVQQLAARYRLGLASSSPTALINYVLDTAGLRRYFDVIVSSNQVGRGKPAPDVFLAAAEQLHCPPAQVVVFEDSSAGIQAARRAGMGVIVVPNTHYPPSGEALRAASLVLGSLQELRPDMVEQVAAGGTGPR